jgi:hypothetical protein
MGSTSVILGVTSHAGCSKSPDFSPSQPRRAETRLVPGKAAASEGPRRYKPHFVWAVRLYNGSWRTDNLLQYFGLPRISNGTLRV